MPTIRRATLDDVPVITQHRHLMFAAMEVTTEAHLCKMDAAFEPWVRSRLADGTYIGLLMEENGKIVAGAGVWLMDWPPHYLHLEPRRGYLLNFYSAPEARGRGFARQLLAAAVAECRSRGIHTITLHASAAGRPIYERFGFAQSTEMMLRPPEPSV